MQALNNQPLIDSLSIKKAFRKNLSVAALSQGLRARFSKVEDKRDKRRVVIALQDALMSAFAMFTLKMPSLLDFDAIRSSEPRRNNLRNLFGVESIPSDTAMREILDEVNPEHLRPAFKDVFLELQRGKALEPYRFINGNYLIAIDGTGYFSSDTIHCASCMEKRDKKTGEVTCYYHQMLGAVMIHPDKKQVVPLCPEPIIKQDGESKNDCERNACARILAKIRQDHPRLGIIITEDGLASNAPHIRDLKKFGMSFILGAKPGDHKYLFEEFSLAGSRIREVRMVDGKSTHVFQYVNDLQLNGSSEDVRVNFLQYEEIRSNGTRLRFSWVTDIEMDDNNVYQIMRGGRARWKIENETYNTLKNQGYEFEHNFGHGEKNLSVVLAYLMMLAFLVDQAQLLASKLVQLALEKAQRLKTMYRTVRNYFDTFAFRDWQELYSAMAYGIETSFTINFPGRKNTS